MKTPRLPIFIGFAAALALTVVTSGCTAASNSATSPTTLAAPQSTSSTTATTPTASPSATPSAADSTSPGTTTGTGTSLRSNECATADLAGSVVAEPGGGGAGSSTVKILLKNENATPCTIQGWPGVSFVGHSNGTQIGAAATFDRQSPHGTVTVISGATAHALVKIADASAYGSSCSPMTADGLRVYPPGQKDSVFIQSSQLHFTACANSSTRLLNVQGFQPGS